MKSFKEKVLDALLVFLLDALSVLIDSVVLLVFALITLMVLYPHTPNTNELLRLFTYIVWARMWLYVIVLLVKSDWNKIG